MDYRVVYDVRDEAGWFLLDPVLLAGLIVLASVCLFSVALDGWLLQGGSGKARGVVSRMFHRAVDGWLLWSVEHPPERLGPCMVRLGMAGCAVFGSLTVTWMVGYFNGGPMNVPVGRLAWLGLSGIVLLGGRNPGRCPPFALSVRLRLILLLVAVVMAVGTASISWGLYAGLRQRQQALEAGPSTVVEGEITRLRRIKVVTGIVVAGTDLPVNGEWFGHLGRRVRLRPGLAIRVTHRDGTILIFEAND